jgi:hypothetical protein
MPLARDQAESHVTTTCSRIQLSVGYMNLYPVRSLQLVTLASLGYDIALLKRGRAICRLVREHVIRHDQGLLFFKGGASFGMSSGGTNGQTDRQAEQFTSSNLVFDLI